MSTLRCRSLTTDSLFCRYPSKPPYAPHECSIINWLVLSKDSDLPNGPGEVACPEKMLTYPDRDFVYAWISAPTRFDDGDNGPITQKCRPKVVPSALLFAIVDIYEKGYKQYYNVPMMMMQVINTFAHYGQYVEVDPPSLLAAMNTDHYVLPVMCHIGKALPKPLTAEFIRSVSPEEDMEPYEIEEEAPTLLLDMPTIKLMSKQLTDSVAKVKEKLLAKVILQNNVLAYNEEKFAAMVLYIDERVDNAVEEGLVDPDHTKDFNIVVEGLRQELLIPHTARKVKTLRQRRACSKRRRLKRIHFKDAELKPPKRKKPKRPHRKSRIFYDFNPMAPIKNGYSTPKEGEHKDPLPPEHDVGPPLTIQATNVSIVLKQTKLIRSSKSCQMVTSRSPVVGNSNAMGLVRKKPNRRRN
jgi:hypothetical protein